MKTFLFCLWCVLLSLVSSCNNGSTQSYRIGVDPSWYPLQLGNRDNNVTAFSTELLSRIGVMEKIAFTRVSTNWGDLVQGLQQKEYDAILSSMPPYLFNQKLFTFSSIYLHLGPVLVTRASSSIDSIQQLQGKEIAVITGSSNDLLLEQSPGVLIRYYDSDAQALNALVQGTIDGALIPILSATAYLRDLYQNELKIVTPPLTEEGLRLVTLYHSSETLIQQFNQALEKLKKEGAYQTLLDKWSLSERLNT